MKIVPDGRDPKTGLQRHKIDFALRMPGKKHATHLHRVAFGSADLAVKIAEIKALTTGSLTAKSYLECSEHYKAHKGYGTKADVFERVAEKLGRYKVDRRFASLYYEYILQVSQGRATNTVNNYRICIRSVINFAYKSGFIGEPPIRSFGIEKMVERDRIWTNDERIRYFNQMVELESHLYWSVRVMEKNPVRGRSDLWKIKTTALVLVGEMAPCIRFFPSKTRERQNRPTYLIELDQDVINYLLWQRKVIPDCPLLFPNMWYSKREKRWKWKPMGDPDRHWRYLSEKAEVADFRIHDLRHVATTYMLEKRDENSQRLYDEDDLKDLGLFYSKRACEIYRNRKAERVVQRVRCSTFVAPVPEMAAQNA